MDEQVKAKWLVGLRSGRYKKGVGALHRVETHTYCCLGVLCELAVTEGIITASADASYTTRFGFTQETAELPPEVVKWAKLDSSNPDVVWDEYDTNLVTLNDDNGLSFAVIAAVIEAQL